MRTRTRAPAATAALLLAVALLGGGPVAESLHRTLVHHAWCETHLHVVHLEKGAAPTAPGPSESSVTPAAVEVPEDECLGLGLLPPGERHAPDGANPPAADRQRVPAGPQVLAALSPLRLAPKQGPPRA